MANNKESAMVQPTRETPTKVFLSYAGHDEDRVRHLRIAFPLLHRPKLYRVWDYKLTGAPFGNLEQAIAARVEESAVFVALISDEYIKGNRLTLSEMKRALLEYQRSGKLKVLLFLVNGPAAERWLEELENPEILALVERGPFAYVRLYDGNGEPFILVAEHEGKMMPTSRAATELGRITREVEEFLAGKAAMPGGAQPVGGVTLADAGPKQGAEAIEQTIQVIGWKGIEAVQLDAITKKNHSLAFLTTHMSLETLPNLEYFPHNSRTGHKFDVAYMDYEFVDRYRQDLNRLHNLAGQPNDTKDEIRELFTLRKIAPALLELMFSGRNLHTMPIYCVPIQFGFNEILVNRKGRLHKCLGDKLDADLSHGDFDLTKLLGDEETKVVVWHWYLPSLLQFLLSAKDTDVKTVIAGLSSDDNRVRNSYDDVLQAHVETVCGLLKKHPEWRSRITVCSTMDEIRSELKEGEAGVVLGQGSSVLAGPKPKDLEHITPIVPAGQGVLVWINCATSVDTTSNKAATVLIPQWFDETTQMNMCKPAADYFGLPANRAALSRVLKERRYAQVKAVQTFIKCTGGDKKSTASSKFSDGMVTHRVLPRQLWGRWVHLWEKFLTAVTVESPK